MSVASGKCNYCERRWPRPLEQCPLCREPLRYVSQAPTMSPEEAVTQKTEFDFGWWLWDTGRM